MRHLHDHRLRTIEKEREIKTINVRGKYQNNYDGRPFGQPGWLGSGGGCFLVLSLSTDHNGQRLFISVSVPPIQ